MIAVQRPHAEAQRLDEGCAEMEALGASALGLNVDATGKQGWHPK